MPTTTRERLEALVPQVQALAAQIEANPRAPRADRDRLDAMCEEMHDLSKALKAQQRAAKDAAPSGLDGLSPAELVAFLASAGNSAEGVQRPSWKAAPIGRRETGWGEAIVAKGATQDGYGFKALVPSGSVVVPSLTAGIVRTADRPRSLLQLVPSDPLQGTDQYSFLRETVRTHAAAPVATGALKPTSVYSVERVDDTVKTIAHLSERIPRQTLADARLLQAYVEGSLREGVELGLEDQIVNGDGTGENLLGIDDTPNIQQQAFSATMLITTRKAVTKLEDVQITSGAFVLAPADWEWLELTADSAGNFILGDQIPVDRAQRKLWGMPVVTSTTLTAGKGFLVDFAGSTKLWEREGVRVDWSESTWDPAFDRGGGVLGATDFERNMIRFRAEGRWGFAVTRPAGVVEIDTAA